MSKPALHSPFNSVFNPLFNFAKAHPFPFVSLIIWLLFFSTYWFNAYSLKEGAVYAKSLATWADGAVHLTYISSMAYQPQFPRFLPIFLGEPFFYPFLADGLSAILVKLGINIFTAYASVGLVLSLIFVLVLYYFYYTFTGNHKKAGLSLNLTLASGGLGFYYFFLDKIKDGFDFTQPILKEYTLLDDFNIFWLNIITGEMLPQRPFLLGMVFGLIILTILWRFYLGKPTSAWQLILAGVLFGLLPITHPHTLLALSVIIFWIFIIANFKSLQLKKWLCFIIPSLIVSLPLIVTRILPKSGDFISWYPGWMAHNKGINPFWFWFINWGFLLPSVYLGLKFTTKHQKLLLLPVLFLFSVSNLFLFQPYEWDNAKIFTWVYVLITPFAASFLYFLFQKKHVFRLTALTLLVLMTASGTIDLVRQLLPHTTIQMFPAQDVNFATQFKSKIPQDAIVLTSDNHLHPVPTLTGRQIVSGYPGWLWSYGLDYGSREADITAIYTGQPNATDLVNKYHITHIVVGPHEYGRYPINSEFFQNHYQSVLQSGAYTVYQVDH